MTSPASVQRGLAAFSEAKTLHAARQYAAAATAYNRALALLPNHPAILLAFANLAAEVQDWRNAEVLCRRLGTASPEANIEPMLANALLQQQRHADAIPVFERGLARGRQPALLHGLALCHAHLGQWEESLALADEAWQVRQEARFLEAVLIALYQLGREEELQSRAGEACRRFPDNAKIRSIYALHNLKSGRDYATAFTMIADMRRNNTGAPAAYDTDAAGKLWDGVPFDGVLRVVADAGLGDQLLGASMFPDLVQCGQRTEVLCDIRLLPLMQRTFPTLRFLPRNAEGQALALAGFDAGRDRRINAIDLGRFYRRTASSFPAGAGWLQADATRVAARRSAMNERWPGALLVGMSWNSARLMEGGARKRISPAQLAPILATPGCAFINLQYGDISADLAELESTGVPALFVDPDVDTDNDLDAYAAQIAALDLVITTSNCAAHFAGAIGVPCLLLLPRSRPVLWYWGYAGERTPWYPGMRILRSESDDDWRALIQRAAGELRARLTVSSRHPAP